MAHAETPRPAPTGEDDTEEAAGNDAGPSRRSKAAQVVQLALASGVHLFHDPTGEAFVDVLNKSTGVRKTLAVRSKACRVWLSGLLYVAEGATLGGQAASDAVDVLEARAVHDGPERSVHVRLAVGDRDEVYVDLGDAAWRAVMIDPEGWEIVQDAPVRFRRPHALGALPVPSNEPGGWEALRHLLNFPEGPDWSLLVGWLVGTLHPSGPYPILGLGGEQGTGKSSLARILRALVDPSLAPLRSPPRREDALVLAARNGHIIGLDNLSGMQAWLSDALCRIATGGGYSTRALYTDGEEAVFADRRPILITSIEDIATRGDLADRTIALELPRMPPKHRRSERDLWAEFERIRPRVLGALFSAVSTALRRRSGVRLRGRPRMADFAEWIVAAEPSLPWKQGEFLPAYMAAHARAARTSLEADALASAIAELLHQTGQWSGKASDLLELLNARRGNGSPPPGWPRRAQELGGRMRRVAPLLHEIGYRFERGEGRDRDRYHFSARKLGRAQGAHSAHEHMSDAGADAQGEYDSHARTINVGASPSAEASASESALEVEQAWLRMLLSSGRVLVDDAKEAAKSAGLHWPDVKDARRKLGFVTYNDETGQWFWDLPERSRSVDDPISVL